MLDERPNLFQSVGGGGTVIEQGGRDRTAGPPPDRAAMGMARWTATTERGERVDLGAVREHRADAAAVRQMTEAIARRLSVRPRRRDRLATRGTGQLVSVPYRHGSDDIDLDRTLEVLTERPVPEDTDIVVRERMRSRRAVVLIIDVSGSMRGDKACMAAATVGALAGDLVDDELAVVAFWRDAALVKPLTARRSAAQILDDLLELPAKGLTNVHFALTVALEQLGRARARRRHGILLSDAVHNAGPDPRLVASRFPRLDVLLETDGEHDRELGFELARMGHGDVLPVRHHRDVPGALNRALGR